MQNYANWASENLYQLIELRGYTNIKYIMLFTEQQRPSGMVPQGKTAYTLWRDCAVAVVNNKSRAAEISVQFSKALGVRLKRRLYNPATIVPDEQAAFLEPDREFDCDDRLTDRMPPNAVVVYSTL